MAKLEAMLEPTEEYNYESSHLVNLYRRYLGNNDENTEMPDVKHMTLINDPFRSDRTTSTRPRSGIQSAQSGFKSLQFTDGYTKQAGRLVKNEDAIAYMEYVLVDMNNNCHPFINNVDYT